MIYIIYKAASERKANKKRIAVVKADLQPGSPF